jgi:transposase-like protein
MKTKNSKPSTNRLVSEAKRNAIIRRALNGKKSRKELAEQYGIKVDTLNTWVRRYGSTITDTTKPVVTNNPVAARRSVNAIITEADKLLLRMAKLKKLLVNLEDNNE